MCGVLGITMVSGNAWEPEEVKHTLRMLELIHRTEVPVVPGAIYPLVRTREETLAEEKLYGTVSVAWSLGDAGAAFRVEQLGTRLRSFLRWWRVSRRRLRWTKMAAHFLVRQVKAHPHEVTVYAAGPLTNIALAIAIEPHFAELTKGIVIMGGSLKPDDG